MSKALIIEAVEQAGRIKATELVARRQIALLDDPLALLAECILEGSIQEIEYTVPQMSYRIKSLLIPKEGDLNEAQQWVRSQGFNVVEKKAPQC